MSLPLQVAFVAGLSGIWRIERITAVTGGSLPPAERLAVIEGPEAQRPLEGSWILRGTTSNWKTAAWWDLAQDERRAIFEEQSRHIGIGMEYLPP
jgi:hypothetical protein